MNPCPKHPRALNDGECMDCIREENHELRTALASRDAEVERVKKAANVLCGATENLFRGHHKEEERALVAHVKMATVVLRHEAALPKVGE